MLELSDDCYSFNAVAFYLSIAGKFFISTGIAIHYEKSDNRSQICLQRRAIETRCPQQFAHKRTILPFGRACLEAFLPLDTPAVSQFSTP